MRRLPEGCPGSERRTFACPSCHRECSLFPLFVRLPGLFVSHYDGLVEQLWLGMSLLSVVTGFGLLVSILLLRRLAPLQLPPVVPAVGAFLLMGVASLVGIYVEVLGVPGSVLPHRLVNAGAWGFVASASLAYLLWAPDARNRRGLMTILPGIAVAAAAFLAAHAPAHGAIRRLGETSGSIVMIAVEVMVGTLVIALGIRAIRQSRRTYSRPWRAFLRGFGLAVLILIPANLLDFGLSQALRNAGTTRKDGFVFAAGYALSNVVLIIAIIRSFRLTATGGPAVPQQLVDAFGITPREREVLDELLLGKSDKEIAEELYISVRTVDTHLRQIFRKCDVSSRLQLAQLAHSYGETLR